MGLVKVSDVYAALHQLLREDEIIGELMGFTAKTTALDKAKRIQKRKIPADTLQSAKLPLISFYKLPGRAENNHLSYVTPFDFDVYTNNDTETAINIADRINELLHDQYVPVCSGSLKSKYVTSAEDATDLKDIYKYFTQILVNLTLEG